MICPVCTEAELKREPGRSSLGGWLVRPDVLRCPSCGSKAETFGNKLRFTFVPGHYAGFLGQALIGSLSPDDAKTRSARARAALSRRETLLKGELRPCPAPIDLRPTETCVYTIPSVTLAEQRTKQGQDYWAEKVSGPLTVTEDNLYVADQVIPIRKINGAILRSNAIDIARSDRKRAMRISFPDSEAAYFATLTISRVVGVLDVPPLPDTPFWQKGLGAQLSIPLGKGRQQLVSPWAVPVLLVVLACTFPCLLGGVGGLLPGSDDSPTNDSRSPSTSVVSDVALLSSTDEVAPTDQVAPTATARPSPTPTEKPTNTVAPTKTATPKPSPSATPTRTPEPANCWNAAYVADVTIPDGTWIRPGTSFAKTWRVRNAGTCVWDDVVLRTAEGIAMGASIIHVPTTQPGATTDITVQMTAPRQEGQARGTWQFGANDRAFGSLTAVINVGVQPTPRPPTAVPRPAQPTSPPAPPAAVCSCSGNLYNCPNFGTHAQAQACFNYCISIGRGDIHRLDADNDGVACESLP